MATVLKVFRYEARNVVRGKALLGYLAFFFLSTWGLIQFGGGVQRALPSLVSVTLLVVPLVSILMSVVGLYEGRDFTVLLLSQPVARPPLWAGRFLGFALPLVGAFLLGVGLPLAAGGTPTELAGAVALLLTAGSLLTFSFVAMGFLVSVLVDEPAKGLGLALIAWLAMTVIYDGGVLAVAQAFAHYPLERPMLVAMVLNPVDLARVTMLMALDASALAGYTGAVFHEFFGGAVGLVVSLGSLLVWIALPYVLSLYRFRRQDL